MSDSRNPPSAPRSSALPLLVCVVLGVFVGVMLGLDLARRLTPAPTGSRLVMQLLAVEHARLSDDARRGRCTPISAEGQRLLLALVDAIMPSLRDVLVVDTAFEREVSRLRDPMQQLASRPDDDCEKRLRDLDAVDGVCRDCHEQYRVGGS